MYRTPSGYESSIDEETRYQLILADATDRNHLATLKLAAAMMVNLQYWWLLPLAFFAGVLS